MTKAVKTLKLTAEEIKSLRLFDKKVRELKENTEFFTNLSINMRFGDFPSEVTKKTPDKKTTKSYLMDFRLFLLQKEAINFYKVCNIISKPSNNIDSSLKEKTAEARKVWSILYDQDCNGIPVSGIGFNLNQDPISQGDILDLWINGKFFHPTDQKGDKAKKFEVINSHPFVDIMEVQFFDTVIRMSQIIFWLDHNVIKEVINAN